MRDLQTPSVAGTVAIATCSAVCGMEEDDLRLIEALGRLGVRADHRSWDDDRADWQLYSLVVVRSTWDYPERREDFLTRAARLKKVLNPLPTLRWNTDKHYLEDLARAGLPVIPTQFLEPGDQFQAPPRPFVIKPAVSCGAKQTARYPGGAGGEAYEHVRSLHAGGRSVMVQPYLISTTRAKSRLCSLMVVIHTRSADLLCSITPAGFTKER